MLVGIDLGSTNIKVALYDHALNRTALLSQQVEYDRRGDIVEFDAMEYFDIVAGLLRKIGKGHAKISAIALTGQAESLVLLDANGIPVRPAISWMDERSREECKLLSEMFSLEECYAVTGQKAIIPTWPATKILHLNGHEPDIIAKTATFAMIKDYIAYRLSGVLAADKSIATFTLYFDIHRGEYWPKMLEACKIKPEQLPVLVEPCEILGEVVPEVMLGEAYSGALVNTGTLDHFAGMIGSGNIAPGLVSESTGTVLAMSAMLLPPLTGRESAALHYGPFPGSYVLLPVAESGGACLEWYKSRFLPQISFAQLDSISAERFNENLLFLPYIIGTNAPEFDSDACGVFYGLSAEHDAYDLARAVMEGVGFLLERNLQCLQTGSTPITQIISTGGGAKSALWSQIKADICGLPIILLEESETACLGAGIIAAVACGIFADYKSAVDACVREKKRFLPSDTQLYERKKRGFDALYKAMLQTAAAMDDN